jgi:1,4-dihydroxy-2-naphthoate octaprenyltransferase
MVSPDPRRFLRRFVPPLVVILAGTVLLGVVDQGTVAAAIGWALVGLGSIWAVSAVFYEVGRSEDRDRERHPRG